MLLVLGAAAVHYTDTFDNVVVRTNLTLGGVARSTWPSGTGTSYWATNSSGNLVPTNGPTAVELDAIVTSLLNVTGSNYTASTVLGVSTNGSNIVSTPLTWDASGVLKVGSTTVTNNQTFLTHTPDLGAALTNIVVDFTYREMTLNTTTNMYLASFSNSASAGNAIGTVLRILANGGNVIVGSGLGSIKVANSSVTFPVTITNGDWGLFSFRSEGSNATNHGVAYSYVH